MKHHTAQSTVLRVRLFALIFIIALLGIWGNPAPVKAQPQKMLLNIVPVNMDLSTNATWTPDNIYYIIKPDFKVNTGVTLTIQAGTIVKFWVPLDPSRQSRTSMTVNGDMVIANDPANPVVFTSGRDDNTGGDTNGDGNQTLAAAGDWEAVILPGRTQDLTRLVVQYSYYGVKVLSGTAADIAPAISYSTITYNRCGITLTIRSNYAINSLIENNTFSNNLFGFCTTTDSGTGSARPTLRANTFQSNRIFPIFLAGSAYPTYENNIITGYSLLGNNPKGHLGIGLSGSFNGAGTFPHVYANNGADDMPYVIAGPTTINTSANITIPAGLVFKAFTLSEIYPEQTPPNNPVYAKLDILGAVTFQSTDTSPIIFTSYHDDTALGDTNDDGTSTEGFAGDWDHVYFKDVISSESTNYTFQYLQFRNAINGLLYEATTSSAVRRPVFKNNVFHKNTNGLRLKVAVNGRLEPLIDTNTFSSNGIIPATKTQTEPGVPIYLENTSQPTYVNNTFVGNLHPAIGVGGTWRSNGVSQVNWVSVPAAGEGLTSLPYLVHGTVWIGNSGSQQDDMIKLTIPAGAVIKFNVNRFDYNGYSSSLLSSAQLEILSAQGSSPVVFTSYYDNAYGGNTSGEVISPAKKDWGEVSIRHPLSKFENVIFRYADRGLHLENNKVSGDFGPAITYSKFEYDEYGLYLDIQNNSRITSVVDSNRFYGNSYGLVTFAKNTLNSTGKVTGISIPTLSNNRFEANDQFPIFLDGSASPTYVENTNYFINNVHPAIALGGYFGSTPDLVIIPQVVGDNAQIFPYVILQDTFFDLNTHARISGNLNFKFDDQKLWELYGPLDLLTSPTDRNTFTSYRDDTVGGDTNGTPTPNPTPAAGQWKGLYVYNYQTPSFSYSTFKYATDGLVFKQKSANNFTTSVLNNQYEANKNGLSLFIVSNADILVTVQGNNFLNNDYGLHTWTDIKTNPYAHYGTSDPVLDSNTFVGSKQFPLYLQGSTNPSYNNNYFEGNTHPGIAVGGYWSRNATWTNVAGDNDLPMPYVPIEDWVEEIGNITPTVTFPANTVVKSWPGVDLYAWGLLNFQSAPGNEVVLTAYADDTYAGNTNADATPLPTTNTAWSGLWLIDFPGKVNNVHDVIGRYAVAALSIYYDGPENTQATTTIERAYLNNNRSGILLAIGWRQVNQIIYPGKGNIAANLTSIELRDSDYGILTLAHSKATGMVVPVLTNVTFTNIKQVPLYLGGTSYPTFASGNSIGATVPQKVSIQNEQPQPVAMELKGDELPGNTAALQSIKPGAAPLKSSASAPQSNLMVSSNDLAPAIGLAGVWNNSGELPSIPGLPYALFGNFPVGVSVGGGTAYFPANSVTIGETNPLPNIAIVTVPPATIFKFATLSPAVKMTVKGALNLLSTPSLPITFTSLKDDAAGGDTNKDGALTQPAKGDWDGLVISSSTAEMGYIHLRYATNGLQLYFDGPANQAITPYVHDSIFTLNKTGITLTAYSAGDVEARIELSRFTNNDTHILGAEGNKTVGSEYTGHLCVEAHNNDILGTTSQVGVVNNNTKLPPTDNPDCLFDATSNFWGDPTGPYHAGKNPGGKGSQVSDRVLFDPWLSNAVFPPPTYIIGGRITKDAADGTPLAGVTVTLQPGGVTQITNQEGYYQFDKLNPGVYTVSASLVNHTFTPTYRSVTLQSDSMSNDFIGTAITTDVTVSVNSIFVNKSNGSNPKVYANFKVTLNKTPSAGTTVTIRCTTVAGTAKAGTDYVALTKTLTFASGGATEQTCPVQILPSTVSKPPMFFTLQLDNPVNVGILNGAGTGTIYSNFAFVPTIRK